MIHPSAHVATDRLGARVVIHENAVVRAGATLGDDVIVHPNVVIECGVTVGDRVEIFPGAHLGKRPARSSALARAPECEQQVSIGRDTSIGPNSVIYSDVLIGERCLIGDGASIREQARIGTDNIISRYVTLNYEVTIGSYCKIMDMTHITGRTKIGDHVFVSTMVSTTNDSAFHERKFDQHIQGPTIDDYASIGASACILPRVHIGIHAIVGAGSVVTRDVAARSLVMGVPARYVRDVP